MERSEPIEDAAETFNFVRSCQCPRCNGQKKLDFHAEVKAMLERERLRERFRATSKE